MTKCLRDAALSLLIASCVPVAGIARDSAPAASPEGEWLVKDKTAHIRLVVCDGAMWGVVSWADKPGRDEHNPDPAKRSRNVLGMPILLGMKSVSPKRWEGNIYNAENGKTYSGSISLASPDALHVSGCVLGGLVCGGEDWKRLAPSRPSEATCEMLKKK